MKQLHATFSFCLVSVLVLFTAATELQAYTAQEIVDCVIDELNNVTDYEASVDVDYDDPNIDDMSDGGFSWKYSSGDWMFKFVMGSPYGGEVRTDGTSGYNVWEYDGSKYYGSMTSHDEWVRQTSAADMFSMEHILNDETWTKDPNPVTVNSVECYRLHCDDYEVWIDTATRTKVIRAKAYDSGDNLDCQLDYSDYSNVESTAQLPGTIVVKRYDDSEILIEEATYTFSSVDINEGLSDSLFTVQSPR